MKRIEITTEDLLKECRKIYKKHGISSFLFKNINKTLYHRLYRKGMKLSDVLEELGLSEEYHEYKQQNIYWNWDRIIKEVTPIVKKQNFLPPAMWFQKNGYPYLIQAVYTVGKNWDDLRKEFNSYENSGFVISRNNMRWRSHPEASLSNFFHSRGIEHCPGRKYPKKYSKFSGLAYGYYDMEFITKNNHRIFVEIWGDKPNGHDEKKYAYKKKLKIEFNKKYNIDFLGINHNDCYSDQKLSKIFEEYIGIIKPFIFKKSYDKIIPSTHWSNADELIEYCREFVKKMPDNKFPTEEWLRKRGKWKDREGQAYNTLSIYIKKWIGGIRKLRSILGQPENSTIKWNKEKSIEKYQEIYKKYGLTTGQLRGKIRRKEIILSDEERLHINKTEAAVLKYFESINDINNLLGIKNSRRRLDKTKRSSKRISEGKE